MEMYFLALVLPPELDARVLVHKQWMQEHYGCMVGLKSPAHITLVAPFWMDETLEAPLKNDISNLSGWQPFELHTKDFDAFTPRTIFIAVEESRELHELQQHVASFFEQSPQYKVKADQRPFHPHITIATRDLFKKSFREAWPHFSQKEFRASWMVEGISLLRHNKKNWDVIYTSQFTNYLDQV